MSSRNGTAGDGRIPLTRATEIGQARMGQQNDSKAIEAKKMNSLLLLSLYMVENHGIMNDIPELCIKYWIWIWSAAFHSHTHLKAPSRYCSIHLSLFFCHLIYIFEMPDVSLPHYMVQSM